MSASRRLMRALDPDLIARIEASGKPAKPKKTPVRAIRHADTYRGARRLFQGKSFTPATAEIIKWRTSCPRQIGLNRSHHWPTAATYAEAATMGAA